MGYESADPATLPENVKRKSTRAGKLDFRPAVAKAEIGDPFQASFSDQDRVTDGRGANMATSRTRPDDVGEIFDDCMAELLAEEHERARRGEPPAPARDESLDPEVARAVAALKVIFDGHAHLTADLSFDQVYAKVLPHFVTIWKHLSRK